jgi:hypothetical protein
MKKILLASVVSSVLLVLLISCEDNSINNPVSAELLNKKAGPPAVNILRGSIILERKLIDPVRVNNYHLLSGKISYSQELILNTPPVIEPGYDVNLDILMDATIKDSLSSIKPNSWKIKYESVDRFFLNRDGSYTLIKNYPIDGMVDRIEMDCIFAVSSQGLKLVSVDLRSPVV